MLFGESFERPPASTEPGQSSYAWQPVVSQEVAARSTVALDNATTFSGQVSQRITIEAAAPDSGATAVGTAGIANRGLGNEGLYLQAGKEYEGYFFGKGDAGTVFEARLELVESGTILAAARFTQPAGVEGFVQHNFTLTPSAGADCVGIAPGSDPAVHCTNNPGTAHVCIKCGGQFVVSVVAGASKVRRSTKLSLNSNTSRSVHIEWGKV